MASVGRSLNILSYLCLILNLIPTGIKAQKSKDVLVDRSASVSFFSDAPLENIEAFNKAARGAMNRNTGEIIFRVPIREFNFEKNLMQKHFNQQYMDSDRFPEAGFDGHIENWKGIPVKDTSVTVTGRLNIHGVRREISETAFLSPSAEGLDGRCTFHVKLKDYKIKVPRIVIKNIAEEIEIRVDAHFLPAESQKD